MEVIPKYINLLTDFGFKRIFGTEANVDLLIDFLNAVLELPSPIARLEFRNTEQSGNVEASRKAIYDIYCLGENGQEFIVEMQKGKITYFKDRALFYATFPVQRQAQKGDWNFKLDPVFYIALLDFFYEPEGSAQLERVVRLRDESNKVFYDKLQFHFFQLPAFNKKETELENRKEKWLYFLKNIENIDEDVIRLFRTDKIFSKMITIAEISKLSNDEYQSYSVSQIEYMEIRGVYENAFMEGELSAEFKYKEAMQIVQKQKEEALERADAMTKALVKALHANGQEAQEIASSANIPLVKVNEILNG